MPRPSLIIITGFPCTGKTTIGKRLAEKLGLPFISKDGIKELLFDNLGWKDRAWSKELSGASYDILYYVTESLLRAEKSLIIETNFAPKFANAKILGLKGKYNFVPFQIRCWTEGEVLWERFKKRAASKERHPGHVDMNNLDEWRPVLLKGKIEALNIGGEIYDIDTTDFTAINYDKFIVAYGYHQTTTSRPAPDHGCRR